jgi:four helix bundle protein
MKENITYNKCYAFAIRIVKAYKYLKDNKKEYVLSKQLLRCGTSIGANVAEANAAISDAEFSSKIGVAYKECLETKYWLNLLKDTDIIDEKSYNSINKDTEEISKILFSILKKTRIRGVLKIVILNEVKNPAFFKINKIDSSLRSE